MSKRESRSVSSGEVIRGMFGGARRGEDHPLVLYTEILDLLRTLYERDCVSTWRHAMNACLGRAVPMNECTTEQLVAFRTELRKRAEAAAG